MPRYILWPRQKNKLTHFKNQRYIGIFMLCILYTIYVYIYDSAGDSMSKPPGSELKICELNMKVQADIFLNRPQYSESPGNQVCLENPHESVKEIESRDTIPF
jgi:hypothetical protein